MEYFPRGDLQAFLEVPLSDADASQITSPIVEGLTYITPMVSLKEI
jgi:hypothetical protein